MKNNETRECELLIRINSLFDQLIHQTPTSQFRNYLCDLNIEIKTVLQSQESDMHTAFVKMKDVLKEEQSMADNTKEGFFCLCVLEQITSDECVHQCHHCDYLQDKNPEQYKPNKFYQSPTPVSEGKDENEYEIKRRIADFIFRGYVNRITHNEAASAIYKEIIEPLKKERDKYKKLYETIMDE